MWYTIYRIFKTDKELHQCDWIRYHHGGWCESTTNIDIVTGCWCVAMTDIDIVMVGWYGIMTDIDIVMVG